MHAIAGPLTGEEAIYDFAIWRQGEFVFTPGQEAETVSIERSNTNLLMEAARRIDEWQVLSKKIPSTRLVPVFTVEGARTSVSLTPQEWSLICRIDERRSIDEIAIGLGSSAFDVCKVLYGLVTSGLVTSGRICTVFRAMRSSGAAVRISAAWWTGSSTAPRRCSPAASGRARSAAARQARVGMASGRPVDALLDLVRAGEKLISAVLGPNQARSFLDHVDRLVDGS